MSKNTNDLVKEAMCQLERLGLSKETLRMYESRAFRPALRLCSAQGIAEFQETAIKDLRSNYLRQYSEGAISRRTLNWRLRGTDILSEVYETGSFEWKVFSHRQNARFSDFFEGVISGFMSGLSCSEKRKQNYESIIRRLIGYIVDRHIHDFKKLEATLVRDFIVCISSDRPKSMDDVMTALRKFFAYLYELDLVDTMLWTLLAAPRSRDRKVRPCMEPNEVSALLRQVDRNSHEGKRDFAILALALSTGLRAGDIASLRLADIDWKRDELHIVQGKTQEVLSLPLRRSVKVAIVDYVLQGRPKSQSQYLFLRHLAPHERFYDGVSIACIFRKYLALAGIEHRIDDGKTFHGLRRMLATKMTTGGVALPLIAQVLGQKSIKATRQYISLDIEGLRNCALGMDSIETGCLS